MDRRKPLLLNRWEVVSDEALAEAAARCGVRVLAKLRLSSALDLSSSGLSNDLFNYGTRAELIADGTDALVRFAVEYDEEWHLANPKNHAPGPDEVRDLRSPRIAPGADRFPLPSPGAAIHFDRLPVEVWNLEREFTAVPERGEIPWDEPFIPEMAIADYLSGRVDFPYWLDRPARLRMVEAEGAASRGAHARGARHPVAAARLPTRPSSSKRGRYLSFDPPDTSSVPEAPQPPGIRPRSLARSLAATVAVADAGRRLDRALSDDQSAIFDCS